MSNAVWDWSSTAANNNAAAPYGWTSGSMKPTDVEPTARQMMATLSEAVHSQVAGGTADAITVTYANAPAALTDGMEVKFRASAANATTTPTLNVNALGAKTITRGGGSALQAGDIVGNLTECTVRYNLANTRWELLSPAIATAVLNSVVTNLTTNTTLTTAQAGGTFAPGATNITATLPALSAVPDGAEYGFQVQNPTFTIAASGTDKIYAPNNWGVASVALTQQGDALRLKKQGTTGWLAVDRAYNLASAADAQAGTNGAIALTPYAMAGAILGSPNQSWQDVTGSRALSTTYTNSTGRPIMVMVGVDNTSGGEVEVKVGAVTVGYAGGAAGIRDIVSFIVMPGQGYAVTVNAGAFSLTGWAELR